jgi:anti-sigma regulatory factor (Ser/Thr protein kinase)
MAETNPALHLTLSDEPTSAVELRAAVDRVAAASDAPDGTSFDVKVAATEALANALKRSAGDGRGVDVRVEGHRDAIEVEVHDRGRFRLDHGTGSDVERGRGIPLMVALVDEVEFASSGEGTRVRIRKRVSRSQ